MAPNRSRSNSNANVQPLQFTPSNTLPNRSHSPNVARQPSRHGQRRNQGNQQASQRNSPVLSRGPTHSPNQSLDMRRRATPRTSTPRRNQQQQQHSSTPNTTTSRNNANEVPIPSVAPALPMDMIMSPESRLKQNLRVLRRIEPSIVTVFDQFPHVCLYHHDGSKWEKAGYEGTMFLFERQHEPRYGFLIMNRSGKYDYIQSIYPSDEIEISGEYVMYNTPMPNQLRKPRYATAGSDIDIDDNDECTEEETMKSGVKGLWTQQTDSREPMGLVLIRLFAYVKKGLPYPDEFRYDRGREPPPYQADLSGEDSNTTIATSATGMVHEGALPMSRTQSELSAPEEGLNELDRLFAKLVQSSASASSASAVHAPLPLPEAQPPLMSSTHPSQLPEASQVAHAPAAPVVPPNAQPPVMPLPEQHPPPITTNAPLPRPSSSANAYLGASIPHSPLSPKLRQSMNAMNANNILQILNGPSAAAPVPQAGSHLQSSSSVPAMPSPTMGLGPGPMHHPVVAPQQSLGSVASQLHLASQAASVPSPSMPPSSGIYLLDSIFASATPAISQSAPIEHHAAPPSAPPLTHSLSLSGAPEHPRHPPIMTRSFSNQSHIPSASMFSTTVFNTSTLDILSPKPATAILPQILTTDVINDLMGMSSRSASSVSASEGDGEGEGSPLYRRQGSSHGGRESDKGYVADRGEDDNISDSSTAPDQENNGRSGIGPVSRPSTLSHSARGGSSRTASQKLARIDSGATVTTMGTSPQAMAKTLAHSTSAASLLSVLSPQMPGVSSGDATPRARSGETLLDSVSQSLDAVVSSVDKVRAKLSMESVRSASAKQGQGQGQAQARFATNSEVWPHTYSPSRPGVPTASSSAPSQTNGVHTSPTPSRVSVNGSVARLPVVVNGGPSDESDEVPELDFSEIKLLDDIQSLSKKQKGRGAVATNAKVNGRQDKNKHPSTTPTVAGPAVTAKSQSQINGHTASTTNAQLASASPTTKPSEAARLAILQELQVLKANGKDAKNLSSPAGGMGKNEFVREVLTLIHTDASFVDRLYQGYLGLQTS